MRGPHGDRQLRRGAIDVAVAGFGSRPQAKPRGTEVVTGVGVERQDAVVAVAPPPCDVDRQVRTVDDRDGRSVGARRDEDREAQVLAEQRLVAGTGWPSLDRQDVPPPTKS